MAFSRSEIREIYRKRAGAYDLSANLYYVLGFREAAYRRAAVEALELEEGATVVEIGCGTGLNFPLLRERIGPDGRIVGVDPTPEMLDQARQRVERHEWHNVELVRSDAASYAFPSSVQGVFSTFALTLEPDYDDVIRRGAAALAPGRRFVVLDFRDPENLPEWALKIAVVLTRPFGVTLDLRDRRPWESIQRHLTDYRYRQFYLGMTYVASGAAGPRG